MDLLLHLVREQEVEIHEVEISRVLKGYLEYLHAMKELDIEVAGEFLVMAATLMAIKSRSLLPRESVDLDDGRDCCSHARTPPPACGTSSRQIISMVRLL
jgi:segregation and condensation protein A